MRRHPLLRLLLLSAVLASGGLAQTEVYLPKNALNCERAVTENNPTSYCNACNREATIGAADMVSVQVGGCLARRRLGARGQTRELSSQDLRVAEFTRTAITFLKPVTFAGGVDGSGGGLSTDTIQPASGTSLTLGGATSTVKIPGNLEVAGNSSHDGLETFKGGIATTIINPANGTLLTLGGATTTVKIPGNLEVAGTSSHSGLETFNGGIKTDVITPASAAAVSIPGAGSASLALGVAAVASETNSVALGPKVQSTSYYTVGIGSNAKAIGSGSTAIGFYAEATGLHSIAIGSVVEASAAYGVAIGYGASAKNGAIVLNAEEDLLSSTQNGFFVKPVRSVGAGSANLAYNHITNEIFIGSSSRRYKKDIDDVQLAEAERLWELRPVTYRGLEQEDAAPKSYGFVAEEVAEVDPGLVFWGTDADGQARVEGVNYDQVVPLLLHQMRVTREAHAARIKALEEKIEALLR